MKRELALESHHTRVTHSVSAQSSIAKLQDQGDAYMQQIEAEKQRIAELDKEIAIMQETVDEQRRRMGGVNASKVRRPSCAAHWYTPLP